ncbi:TniQ family protein (plasmid) [Skermanella rosea]|uniref:TniQ family protein n=1 Tax=Skermanella rosea TaxID=1817965 RepID=UPI0019349254|nr:TniQ family protein [Skermanella rosea]UEM07270.1 TniQ family protein [Skermanella rosea]
MTGRTLFSTVPALPVVPLPVPGEALGSWIAAIAQTYGLTMREYFGRLEIPRRWVSPLIERDLVIRPLPSMIKRLQADTGIAKDVLLGMTFAGLDQDLEDACQRHRVPCSACANEASRRAGRPVGLLHARAVWRVVCPDHPPCLKPVEVGADVPLAPFYGQVREIITFLDRAAFDPTAFASIVGKRLAPAITVGAFVRFVHLLNAYLSVRVAEFDALRDQAGFRIVRAFARNGDGEPLPLPPDARNDPAVSLVLAWHLVANPLHTLLAGLHTINPVDQKTAQDAEQFTALIHLLLEFWPGEMLAQLLTGKALSRRDWGSDGVRSALAIALTKHWSNDPSHAERLAEAHWNHAAWTGILFSAAIRKRHPQRMSQFPIAGPFRYRHVAAGTKAAGLIGQARRDAWRRRTWSTRAGLWRFMAKPDPTPGRRAPERTASVEDHIAQSVRLALEAHGPLPTKRLRARQRRALLRKLSATAIKGLNQGHGGT